MKNQTLNQLGFSSICLSAFVFLSACEIKVDDATAFIKVKTTDEKNSTWLDSEQLICRNKTDAGVLSEITITKLRNAMELQASQKMLSCAIGENNEINCPSPPPPNSDSNLRYVHFKNFNLNDEREEVLLSETFQETNKSYGILLSNGSTFIQLIQDSDLQAILVREGISTVFSCSNTESQTQILGPTADYFNCHSFDGKIIVNVSPNLPQLLNSTAIPKTQNMIAQPSEKIYSITVYNDKTNERSVFDANTKEINPESVVFNSEQLRLKASRSLDEDDSFYGTLKLVDSYIELSCSNE